MVLQMMIDRDEAIELVERMYGKLLFEIQLLDGKIIIPYNELKVITDEYYIDPKDLTLNEIKELLMVIRI